MKWIGERISFVDTKEKATFVIYPPKIGWKIYVMYVWSALWILVGVAVISQLFLDYTEKEKITLIIFLSFWLYFAVRVIRALIFLITSREFILIDDNGLHIKKATGKFGKSKRYFLENISKMRIPEVKENSFQAVYDSSPWVRGSDAIMFDYLGKTISFGRKLTEKDAKLLFNILVKKIDSAVRKKKK